MNAWNNNNQWSLTGNEDSLLFKTNEKKDSGKTEVIERKVVDPNSEEGKAIFAKFAKSIVDDTPKQPTDEQLFGHLVVTEEQVQKADFEWENKLQLGYEEASKPVDPQDENQEWGMCKSFKDNLTEEELKKYERES